jgi:hypothetical protein
LHFPEDSPQALVMLFVQVAKTYGKVFHFWQVDKGDSLPLGLPQLMMSFTSDGQLNPALAAGQNPLLVCKFELHEDKIQMPSRICGLCFCCL